MALQSWACGRIGPLALAMFIGASMLVSASVAQEVSPEQMQAIQKLPPDQRAKAMQELQRRGMQPGGAQPGGEAKPAEEKKPEGEKKEGEGEKKEEVKTIKRPTDKPKSDPAELKITPDKDGMIQFNFRSQPWTDVLEWFAGVAGYSLDWQELPADALNLSTQRRYTIAETRDMLNRHLLARGFTMILQGEVLTVVKTDKIDPSLVPRVEADDLDDHAPHDFVRTRFPVPDAMDPAKAVEDVKLLLSPAHKVTPLLASKQLQVIDAVANLRDVRDLLYGEQLEASKDVRPRHFGPFRYRRADYIADQVMIVLGLDPASRKNPMELQLEQQRMQLYMQMQQQGKDITAMLKKDGPQVFIATDKRRNTLLVNAPPKEMEIVERTIEQFDVPENGLATGGAGGRELSFRRHATVSVSPDAVITALKEMGDLHPLTQLQSDSQSKTIFAYATADDHKTIESLIDKLDGTGRKLWPIWLNRRTPADQVAGTIKALMVGEKKEDDSNRRPYWYYDPWDRNGGDDVPDTGFRIQADVENNRLLLWANEDEHAEVTALLKELGAIASGNGANPNKFRVLEARTPEETAELLERLQQTWGGRNPLNIQVAPPEEKPDANEPAATQPEEKLPNKDKLTLRGASPMEAQRRSGSLPLVGMGPTEHGRPEVARAQGGSSRVATGEGDSAATRFALLKTSGDSYFSLVAQVDETQDDATVDEQPSVEGGAETPVEQPAAEQSVPAEAPPINVTVTPDGRIVISSDDVAALDQLEDLLSELEPPRRDFEVFPLKNASASLVVLNLEEYFDEELADSGDDFSRWYWGDDQESDDPATLGKARKLRFIWDYDTNTIVVQNASDAQLEVIRKLIEIYDQPVSEDAVAKRRTDIVQIKYSRAQDIATAIKEVYRDLLSSKDKEFQNREGNERDRGSRGSSYSFWGGSSSQKSAPMKMSFEGALSIGVDEISNTLIICADEQIWDTVKDLAVSLDEKAKPDTVVQVHQLRGSLDAEELQDALDDALSRPWPGGKPLEQGRGGGDRGGGGGDRGGDRDRGRRDRDRD